VTTYSSLPLVAWIFRWDLSVRLGYFVTISSLLIMILLISSLGFERKARLFCDLLLHQIIPLPLPLFLLGFERKARLFCDP